jgi:hypothetical protein
MVRRLIVLAVGDAATRPDRASLFALDATRTPLFFADIDVHTLSVLSVEALGPGTGWGRVPTPMF